MFKKIGCCSLDVRPESYLFSTWLSAATILNSMKYQYVVPTFFAVPFITIANNYFFMSTS